MKVLIYATATQGPQEAAAYEEAIRHHNCGDEVLFVHCGSIMKGCHKENPYFLPFRCTQCERCFNSRAHKFLPKSITYRNVGFYYDEGIKSTMDAYVPSYANHEELRTLVYKNVEIGYGALSTFITQTRDLAPELNPVSRNILDKLLRQQVLLTELGLKIIEDFKPDLIYTHNGRLAQYRPIINLAQHLNIPYITTEFLFDAQGTVCKNYYHNSIPHNAQANVEKYRAFWEQSDPVERENFGRAFFENRKRGIYAGDKIYIKDQVLGSMPDEWVSSKRHIVIFNSSEDEFAALNKEVDSTALFNNQIEGIRAIIDRYGKREDWQIVLRVHPHLQNVKYTYHTDLYDLKADNLLTIPSDSPVSSYALMDAADLVIVFGSTMGVESAYWHKPVICLAYSFYRFLDVVYVPKDVSELWTLIEDEKLQCKNTQNCLLYGNYYMSTKHERFEILDIKRCDYSILGHKIRECNYLKFCGSTKLYHLLNGMMLRVNKAIAFRRGIIDERWNR